MGRRDGSDWENFFDIRKIGKRYSKRAAPFLVNQKGSQMETKHIGGHYFGYAVKFIHMCSKTTQFDSNAGVMHGMGHPSKKVESQPGSRTVTLLCDLLFRSRAGSPASFAGKSRLVDVWFHMGKLGRTLLCAGLRPLRFGL